MSEDSVFNSADPATVDAALEAGATDLDLLGKMLGAAVEEYNAADEAWLVYYDAVAEELRESYLLAGRKSDPAEHVIVTETRRQHRAEYTRWKRAKRAVQRIEKQMQAASTVTTARMSQAKALREEMRIGAFSR